MDAAIALEATPASAAGARRFLRQTIHDWGVEWHNDDAELLISELVTNAVVHGRGRIHVHLSSMDGALRVEVADADPTPPRLLHVGTEDERGRGMTLVDRLAHSSGVVVHDDGKIVWFEVALESGNASSGEAGTSAGGGAAPRCRLPSG